MSRKVKDGYHYLVALGINTFDTKKTAFSCSKQVEACTLNFDISSMWLKIDKIHLTQKSTHVPVLSYTESARLMLILSWFLKPFTNRHINSIICLVLMSIFPIILCINKQDLRLPKIDWQVSRNLNMDNIANFIKKPRSFSTWIHSS